MPSCVVYLSPAPRSFLLLPRFTPPTPPPILKIVCAVAQKRYRFCYCAVWWRMARRGREREGVVEGCIRAAADHSATLPRNQKPGLCHWPANSKPTSGATTGTADRLRMRGSPCTGAHSAQPHDARCTVRCIDHSRGGGAPGEHWQLQLEKKGEEPSAPPAVPDGHLECVRLTLRVACAPRACCGAVC
jgi:hypothetical protein